MLPLRIVQSALRRLVFTWDPLVPALAKAADDAYRIGFVSGPPNLATIAELGPLNSVLAERHLPLVEVQAGEPATAGGPK
jgi:hypothetical protein